MKNAKLLKSAVLSTALLFVGGAQAQSADGTTSVIIQTAASVTVSAGALSFGTHSAPDAATNVLLTCASGSVSTVTPTPTAAGSCGVVGVSTTSTSAVSYRVAVTSSALTSGSNSLTTSAFIIYNASGNGIAATVDQSVVAGTDSSFRVGGTVGLGASQAAGTYTGTYTFTATIQ